MGLPMPLKENASTAPQQGVTQSELEAIAWPPAPAAARRGPP